jgi:hypothetical protein
MYLRPSPISLPQAGQSLTSSATGWSHFGQSLIILFGIPVGPWVKCTQINCQAKMKPPAKSLLSFKNRSQASGWIKFEADYIKAKFQKEEFRFQAKVNNRIISKLFNTL